MRFQNLLVSLAFNCRFFIAGSTRLALLLPIVVLLLMAAPATQAAGCVFYDDVDGSDTYINFGGGNYLSGSVTAYADASCQDTHAFGISFGQGA